MLIGCSVKMYSFTLNSSWKKKKKNMHVELLNWPIVHSYLSMLIMSQYVIIILNVQYGWTSALCFPLISGVSPGIRQARGAASRANHLQLQSGPAGLLKLRPSAPVSSWSDRPETASRPARPQKTWFYSSTVWTRTAGGGGGWRGSPPWVWGEGPCLTNYVLPEHTKKHFYIFSFCF